MLEVILLIAAVVIGIAIVMRMDTTPRAPRNAAPAPEPAPAAESVVDTAEVGGGVDDVALRTPPATGSVAA